MKVPKTKVGRAVRRTLLGAGCVAAATATLAVPGFTPPGQLACGVDHLARAGGADAGALPFAVGDIFCAPNPAHRLESSMRFAGTMYEVHLAGDGYRASTTQGWTRRSQPSAKDLREEKARGARFVLNLRETDAERSEVERLGMRYIDLPIVDMNVLGTRGARAKAMSRPDAYRKIDAVLESIRGQKGLIHCKKGVGRTGTIVAIARIAYDGWSAEHALKEANRFGLTDVQEDFIRGYADWRYRNSLISPTSPSAKPTTTANTTA